MGVGEKGRRRERERENEIYIVCYDRRGFDE